MRRLCTLITILLFLFASLAMQAADRLAPSLAERERMARESRQAMALLGDYHYLQKPVSSFKTEEIIRSWIKFLDYSRMFFTESQIKATVKHFEPTLQTVYLARGDLYPAIDIYNTYYRTAKTRLRWVRNRLKGDFDFNTSARFAPDRSKAKWPTDLKEADALWNERLTYELLTERLNGRSLADAKTKLMKRYERSEKLLEEFDSRDLQAGFLTSLAQMYDPHSNFFSTDELEDFSITMSNTLVGIGALLKDEDGVCVVQELIPGGPAETSGLLHPGDKILEVSQENEVPVDVVDLKISKIVKMIRGEPGSTVILTVNPAGAPDAARKVIKLERNEVHLTENLASARVIEVPEEDRKTISIGVIELPSFYGGNEGSSSTTTQDIQELIEKLQGMGIKGLVLDLRRNGGGLLNEAINVVGLFVPRTPAVQVRDGTGNVKIDTTAMNTVVYEGPLVVLTSRESASASEIVAGALQCLGRAVVVGDKATHGKGTVQAIFEIDRGLLAQFIKQPPSGAIKITIQKFYLPNGASTQNKGVPSDIALPSINDYLPIGESDLPSALPWDTIKAAPARRDERWNGLAMLQDDTRDYLLQRSQERQQALPEFKYLNSLVKRLKARQEEKAQSLNYDIRLKQKNLDESFSMESEHRRKELSRDRFASAEVLLDISWKMRAEHQEQLKNTPLPDGRARVNEVYDSVFYYEPKGGLEIKEINAQKLDYNALAAYTEIFAKRLELKEAQVKALWESFKQGENRSEFNVEQNFKKALGESVFKDKLAALPKKFFEVALELNPELSEEHPGFDIPLRESLRIAADWVSVSQSTLTRHVQEEEPVAKK